MHSDDPEMHSSDPASPAPAPTFKFMPQPRNANVSSSHPFARSQQQKQLRAPSVPFSLNPSAFRTSGAAPRFSNDNSYENVKPSRSLHLESKPTASREPVYDDQYNQRSSPTLPYALPPTPVSEQRPRSRASSVLQDVPPGGFREPDELDIAQIMTRKMKEADMAKQQLANERQSVARLTAEHKVVRKENAEMQERLSRSEATLASQQSDLRTRTEELRMARTRLAEVESQFSSREKDLAEAQKSFQSEASKQRDEFASKIQAKVDEMEALRVKLTTSAEERAEKIKRTARKGLEDLGKRYDTLQVAYTHLRTSQEATQKELRRCKDEIVSTRDNAEEALDSMREILDHTGHYWVKGAETRGVIEELQADRENGRVVNDMLRSKLEIQGGELATALSKITELEQRETDRETKRMREISAMEGMGSRMQNMAEKLVKKEDSEYTLLGENLALKQRIEDVNQQFHDLENRLAQGQASAQEAEAQQSALKLEIGLLQNKVEDKKEELKAACLSYEDKLTGLRSANFELKEQVGLWKKQSEIQWEELKRLNPLVDTLRKNAEGLTDEARKATMQLSALQDRFDSQGLTLTLTKEECGNIQERLTDAEKASAEERATLLKDKAVLEVELAKVRETSYAIVEELTKRLEDHRTLSAQNLAVHTQNLELQSEKATRADQQVAEFSNVITDLRTVLTNQTTQLDFARAELAQTKSSIQEEVERETATLVTKIDTMVGELDSVRSENTTLSEEANKSKAALDRLREEYAYEKDELVRIRDAETKMRLENERLSSNQTTLAQRYKDGQLSEEEKLLVTTVMVSSQNHHEREMVQKENELRGRDNMVQSLQAKVKDLEASLSQRLSDYARDIDAYKAEQKLLDAKLKDAQSKVSLTAPLKLEPRYMNLDSSSLSTTKKTTSPTFAELSKSDDISDEDDDKPLKPPAPSQRKRPAHDRPASPMEEEDRARPSRRAKINAQKKIDILPETQQDMKPVAPKAKARRRY